jgi:hypothetical protein
VLKKILLVLIFLFPINSIQADIEKIKFNGKIRYFSTLVNDYGVNYDDTRPGPVLDLHFTYPINEKLSVKSFNYIINYNDATSGDETANIKYNQKLGLVYKLGGNIFFPYGKIEYHDENPNKQIDSSHLGLVVEKYFSKDLSISVDYREELSDGAVTRGGIRHSEKFFDLQFNKKNFLKINDRPVHLKIGYAESVNLRGIKTIKFVNEITDKIEFNLKYIDNMGKGPIGSNNLAQNRDYLIGEIGYKF